MGAVWDYFTRRYKSVTIISVPRILRDAYIKYCEAFFGFLKDIGKEIIGNGYSIVEHPKKNEIALLPTTLNIDKDKKEAKITVNWYKGDILDFDRKEAYQIFAFNKKRFTPDRSFIDLALAYFRNPLDSTIKFIVRTKLDKLERIGRGDTFLCIGKADYYLFLLKSSLL